MSNTRQFGLPFPHDDRFAPSDFCPGAANAAALAWLEAPLSWPLRRLAVHGEAGTGKSHLLHVFAARHAAALMTARTIEMLAPPPEAPCLAIDEADDAADQEALLHLLNGATERGQPVLLAARAPPSRWGYTLPDLVSRLRATATVALLPPEDTLLESMLARLLADRQLRVAETVQAYLLARLPRTGGALRAAVEELDRLSLAAGGTVSRQMAQMLVEGRQEGLLF